MAQRIHSIDMVRAIALLGILLVHCMQTFHAFYPEPAECIFPAYLNVLSKVFVSEIIQSKSMMVFSFLFGMSFFLQMDHARERGVDFRGRFCWRLFLLFCIGVLHNLVYRGDILTTFAVVGIVPVLFWNKPTWFIASCVAVCLLQPLMMAEHLFHHPEWSENMRVWLLNLLLPGVQPVSYAHATLPDILSWNFHYGVLTEWIWNLMSGRLFYIIGMFLMGLLAGRSRIFEGDKKRLLCIAVGGMLLWGIYWGARLAGVYMGSSLPNYAYWLGNAAFVVFFIPFVAWVFSHSELPVWITTPLSSVGRCTLTCYVTQGVLLSAFFCEWGLGMHLDMTTRLVFGLSFFVIQMLCCTWWLRHFKFGPLEGVWRRLTRIGLQK